MKEAEKPLSKAEKKQKRREENRQWMARNKGGWSDDDPNPRHSQYYRIQLPELEGEWKQFVDAMRMDLKSTFRISETCNPFLASLLRSALEANKRPRGQFIAVKGEAFHGPVFREVPWCDATYELAVDGSSLASERGLRKLNQLLVREVAMGHLVRQELVSMIPASLIDIHRDHAVLDICAAPGSKTEQLLGMMAASNGYGHSAGKGILVANDIDSKRIGTIQQRLHRSTSPQFILTNGNAALWSSYLQCPNKEVFDRILCDVPCSGDGTFRKCPHLWRLFRPRLGLEFHEVQVSILMESIRLLKPGGLLAYSTCSLNPLEDEAVLAAALRRYPDHLELVDCSVQQRLPGLKYRPGVSSWRSDVDVFTVGEENEADQAQSQARLPPLSSTMHAPSKEEGERMALHRCLRIVPQDQDTGGFFIAVLRKTKPFPPSAKRLSSQMHKSHGDKSSGKEKEKERTASSETSLQIIHKASHKKKKGSAVEAMVALGYNPKAEDETCGLRQLRRLDPLVDEDRRLLDKVLGQSIGVLSGEMEEEKRKKKTGSDWQVVEDRQLQTYSLVSTSAWEALSAWGDTLPVVQCGVSLAKLRPTDSALMVDAFNSHRVGRQVLASVVPTAAVSVSAYRELLQAMASLAGPSPAGESEEVSSGLSRPVDFTLQASLCAPSQETASVSLIIAGGASPASSSTCASLSPAAGKEFVAVLRSQTPRTPSSSFSSFSPCLHLVCEGLTTASASRGGPEGTTSCPVRQEQRGEAGDMSRKRRLSKAEQRKRAKARSTQGDGSGTAPSGGQEEAEEASHIEIQAVEEGGEEKEEKEGKEFVRRTFSIPVGGWRDCASEREGSTWSVVLRLTKPEIESQQELIQYFRFKCFGKTATEQFQARTLARSPAVESWLDCRVCLWWKPLTLGVFSVGKSPCPLDKARKAERNILLRNWLLTYTVRLIMERDPFAAEDVDVFSNPVIPVRTWATGSPYKVAPKSSAADFDAGQQLNSEEVDWTQGLEHYFFGGEAPGSPHNEDGDDDEGEEEEGEEEEGEGADGDEDYEDGEGEDEDEDGDEEEDEDYEDDYEDGDQDEEGDDGEENHNEGVRLSAEANSLFVLGFERLYQSIGTPRKSLSSIKNEQFVDAYQELLQYLGSDNGGHSAPHPAKNVGTMKNNLFLSTKVSSPRRKEDEDDDQDEEDEEGEDEEDQEDDRLAYAKAMRQMMAKQKSVAKKPLKKKSKFRGQNPFLQDKKKSSKAARANAGPRKLTEVEERHRAMLSDMSHKRKQEEEEMLQQIQAAEQKRKKFKEALLEKALKARQDQLKEEEEKKKSKSVHQILLTDEDLVRREEEKREYIASVRRKFKEQHKRVLQDLLEKKRNNELKAEQEMMLKELSRKKAKKRLMRMLASKGLAAEDKQSPARTGEDDGPRAQSAEALADQTKLLQTPDSGHKPASVAVGSGLAVARQRASVTQPSYDRPSKKKPAKLLRPASNQELSGSEDSDQDGQPKEAAKQKSRRSYKHAAGDEDDEGEAGGDGQDDRSEEEDDDDERGAEDHKDGQGANTKAAKEQRKKIAEYLKMLADQKKKEEMEKKKAEERQQRRRQLLSLRLQQEAAERRSMNQHDAPKYELALGDKAAEEADKANGEQGKKISKKITAEMAEAMAERLYHKTSSSRATAASENTASSAVKQKEGSKPPLRPKRTSSSEAAPTTGQTTQTAPSNSGSTTRVSRSTSDDASSPPGEGASTAASSSAPHTSATASSAMGTIPARDFKDWKRKNGCPPDAKVFCMTGWYPCVKQALLDRGWFFNPDPASPYCHLKWTLRSVDVNQDTLQPWQLTNHYLKNVAITTKAGLIKSLQSMVWLADVDCKDIIPRAYDLSIQDEMQAFLDDFRCQKAEQILKKLYYAVFKQDPPVLYSKKDQDIFSPPTSARAASASGPRASSSSGDPGRSKDAALPESSGCGGSGDGEEEFIVIPAMPSVPPSVTWPEINPVILEAACNILESQLRPYDDAYLDEPLAGSDSSGHGTTWMANKMVGNLEWELISSYSVSNKVRSLPFPAPDPVDAFLFKDDECGQLGAGPAGGGENAASLRSSQQWQREKRRWLKQQEDRREQVSQQISSLRQLSMQDMQRIHRLLCQCSLYHHGQHGMNGDAQHCENIWIVKPAAKSRGRGITTFNDLPKLLKYVEAGSGLSTQWIVQKYMENPLTIAKRKFDMRQWVLVTDWNPLTIYFYHECYARFSVDEYTTNNQELDNCYVHLVNNSIGKNSENFHKRVVAENGVEIDGYMWSFNDLANYLQYCTGGNDVLRNKIQPRMKDIAKWSLMCASEMIEHRKNSWELYGFDYMVDSNYNAWLIEINSSPACDYSTKVTENYVQKALVELLGVVLDVREWEALPKKSRGTKPDTGGWECIYTGHLLDLPVGSFGTDMSLKGEAVKVRGPRPAPIPVATIAPGAGGGGVGGGIASGSNVAGNSYRAAPLLPVGPPSGGVRPTIAKLEHRSASSSSGMTAASAQRGSDSGRPASLQAAGSTSGGALGKQRSNNAENQRNRASHEQQALSAKDEFDDSDGESQECLPSGASVKATRSSNGGAGGGTSSVAKKEPPVKPARAGSNAHVSVPVKVLTLDLGI